MTDKEKAEEYTNNRDCYVYDCENNGIDITGNLRQAYLDGLAEGRKEYSESPCTSCCIIERLESDLSELNYQFVNLTANAKELKEENAELKAMFDFVCKQRFGYAWNMNKDVYIADIKKALNGEKTQWV